MPGVLLACLFAPFIFVFMCSFGFGLFLSPSDFFLFTGEVKAIAHMTHLITIYALILLLELLLLKQQLQELRLFHFSINSFVITPFCNFHRYVNI